ncbi:hypothetical protein [Roseateles albus]|uniref:Uncharacterized protein n=1 Tax=Roseateles albus TaxID=2987525 RepID=A0ABT5KCZ4_9BURK|nr:hypothetical protein [Roseateles albus]MDC8771743.1 hypothetical protein [Roseateles albus]
MPQAIKTPTSIKKVNRQSEKSEGLIGIIRNQEPLNESADYLHHKRLAKIEHGVHLRTGWGRRSVSKALVITQASTRYFDLIEQARRNISDLFTHAEFATMLSTTCSEIWDWRPGCSMAVVVADSNGIDLYCELTDECDLHVLLKKLLQLDMLENEALFDICECAWRGASNLDLEDYLENFDFLLKAG